MNLITKARQRRVLAGLVMFQSLLLVLSSIKIRNLKADIKYFVDLAYIDNIETGSKVKSNEPGPFFDTEDPVEDWDGISRHGYDGESAFSVSTEKSDRER